MESMNEPITLSRRRRRRRIGAGVAILLAGAVVFVLVYFEPQAAFIDDTVHESLAGLDAVIVSTTVAEPVASSATTAVADPAPVAVPSAEAPPSTVSTPSTAPASANSVSAAMVRAAQTGQPVIVSTGTFISGEHDTAGTALVIALPDGSLVVRFEDLDTSNGPDLRVVLSPEPASDSWQYDDRLPLGELKGNIGDQNYAVDAGTDLSGYRSVVIWCKRFSVAFGAASIDVVA